jgi:UDP-glucose 4-epimerase
MNLFKNKVIVVFGGTGSFGQAFLDRISNLSINEIRIFSRDEKKQDDLRNIIKNKNIKFYIGDIRDKQSVLEVSRGADIAFHAAALKQVPSCEFYPLEAIKTNVLGTQNIIESVIQNKVKKLVCLSTDKAVSPINAMGMSKALMEKVVVANTKRLEKSDTKIMITRYGNVLFSRGSVLPLFINQILKKKYISITDPNMTRFVMSLHDAIDLVFFALTKEETGNIYIPKTPATSMKILAESLLKIYDYPKNKLKVIGVRHGEKIHETLMSSHERFFSRDYGKYYSVSSDNRDLNYDLYFNTGRRNISKDYSDYTSENAKQLNLSETIDLLKPLIKNLKIY